MMPIRTEIDPLLKTSNAAVRSTVEMRGSTYYLVYRLTREYKLSIGHVIDELMKIAMRDEDELRRVMEIARRDKRLNVIARSSVSESVAEATPAQLAMIAAILEGTPPE